MYRSSPLLYYHARKEQQDIIGSAPLKKNIIARVCGGRVCVVLVPRVCVVLVPRRGVSEQFAKASKAIIVSFAPALRNKQNSAATTTPIAMIGWCLRRPRR